MNSKVFVSFNLIIGHGRTWLTQRQLFYFKLCMFKMLYLKHHNYMHLSNYQVPFHIRTIFGSPISTCRTSQFVCNRCVFYSNLSAIFVSTIAEGVTCSLREKVIKSLLLNDIVSQVGTFFEIDTRIMLVQMHNYFEICFNIWP